MNNVWIALAGGLLLPSLAWAEGWHVRYDTSTGAIAAVSVSAFTVPPTESQADVQVMDATLPDDVQLLTIVDGHFAVDAAKRKARQDAQAAARALDDSRHVNHATLSVPQRLDRLEALLGAN